MSIVFSTAELISIAIGIEKKGIAFYDIMARTTDDAATRDIFQQLAHMERTHIQIFQDMGGASGKNQPAEAASEEYKAYLQALIDSAIFSDEMISSEMVTQADSTIKALELSISAEKDSILFYYEMRDIMPRSTLAMIEKIIAEEKLHLRQLSAVKKRFTETAQE